MGPSSRPTIEDLEECSLPAGYALKTREGYSGTRGRAFTYITAANGVLIRARNDLLEAATLIGAVEQAIRGLDEEEESLRLLKGPVPEKLLMDAIRWTMEDAATERLFSVRWNGEAGEYQVAKPEQTGSPTSLEYEKQHDGILELHSHGEAPAGFSSTDNRDEQGFRIYGVAGTNTRNGTRQRAFRLRLGIYGAFRTVKLSDIIKGESH